AESATDGSECPHATDPIEPRSDTGNYVAHGPGSDYVPPSADELVDTRLEYKEEQKSKDRASTKEVPYKSAHIVVGYDLTREQIAELLRILDGHDVVFSVDGKTIGCVKGIQYKIPLKPGARSVKHAPARIDIRNIPELLDQIGHLQDQNVV